MELSWRFRLRRGSCRKTHTYSSHTGLQNPREHADDQIYIGTISQSHIAHATRPHTQSHKMQAAVLECCHVLDLTPPSLLLSCTRLLLNPAGRASQKRGTRILSGPTHPHPSQGRGHTHRLLRDAHTHPQNPCPDLYLHHAQAVPKTPVQGQVQYRSVYV